MDVENTSGFEREIELLRNVLKLPEDLITKIVSLNYEDALENITVVFTEYDPDSKTYILEEDNDVIKMYNFTDVDSYSVDFNGYRLCEYDSRETCESICKEFVAYSKMMSLILEYQKENKR